MMSANTTTILASTNLSKVDEHPIVKYISTFATLTLHEKEVIAESSDIRTFKKGSLLLSEGETNPLCYFLIKGIVRQYYLIDGEERTTFFYMDGEPVFTSSVSNQSTPSKFYLECLEECTLSVADSQKEVEMFKKYPRFESLCRIKTEDMLQEYQEMLASYITSSPEERYLQVLKKRPDLLHRVPQYQLASYIGVKPESLSRIRMRLMAKM